MWRVVCTWWQITDGRTLTYAHQRDYDTAPEGWAAFHNEKTAGHPGQPLQVDLYDLREHHLADSWTSQQGIDRSESPVVSVAKLRELRPRLAKLGHPPSERHMPDPPEVEERDP